VKKLKYSYLCLLFVCLSSGCGHLPGDSSTVFLHVNVVPMNIERFIPDQTVVVSGNTITAVGATGDVAIPRGATIIDGAGKFLLPGLADMHVHLETVAFGDALGLQLEEEIPFEFVLRPYLRHGVTTIRVMSGAPDLLEVRDRVHSGALVGPNMLVASPMIDGDPPILPPPLTRVVTSTEEAREAVREYSDHGYDLIKVRTGLSRSVYDAIIDEAQALRMFVDGHVPRGDGMSAEHALSSQHGIAHLEEFVYATGDMNRGTAKRFAEAAAAQGLFVTTTVGLYPNIIAQLADLDSLLDQPEVSSLYPLVIDAFWRPPGNPYLSATNLDQAWLQMALEFQRMLVTEFSEAGVILLAGTDALNPALIPGSSLWDELTELVNSGLSPFEALRTATVNPSVYLDRRPGGNMIAPDRRANLILLGKNPLVSIDHLSTLEGTMINGQWLVFDEDAP
jgi:hypothetical protein